MRKGYSDSTLMRMKKEQLIEIIRCLEHNVEAVEDMNKNQFALLMEKEKYAWHDLRKNPEDLPPIAETVIAWFERGDVCAVVRYHDGYAYNEAYALRAMQIEHQSEIVAWKFPEPFEEVE